MRFATFASASCTVKIISSLMLGFSVECASAA
jgi:hypothetical protein